LAGRAEQNFILRGLQPLKRTHFSANQIESQKNLTKDPERTPSIVELAEVQEINGVRIIAVAAY
jgi:hypothetical protein